MKPIIAIFLLCLLLLLPVSAWPEDIVSTWRHKNGNTIKLAMRDANRVRMDTGTDKYILLEGENMYMVTRQDGQWTAMDMDVLAGMMNRFGIQARAAEQKADAHPSRFEDTGRTETVAGYKGNVYVAETKDADGRPIDHVEIVFSKHADVEAAGKAWLRIASRLGDILGARTAQEIETASVKADTADYGGILRVGEMSLVSIAKPALDAAYFDLPEGAEVVDAGAVAREDAQAGSAAADSDLAGELAKDAGDPDREMPGKNPVDDVKKGVDGLFKKIFNPN